MNWKPIVGAVVVAALFVPVQAEALETNELLALVAMPLAVAAVSEVTDVPMSDLMDVVTLLNDANVPPVQFVEVVRYAPVALVVEAPTRTPFVEFVRTQYEGGILGIPLVTEIEREIRYYGVPEVELDVVAPRVVVRDEDFIPAPVRTRLVEYRRDHPHGGPPGQLKKQLGVKTGAEVVHRSDNDSGRASKADKPVAKHVEKQAEKRIEKNVEKHVAKQVEKNERKAEHKAGKHEQKHEQKEKKHDGNQGGKGKGTGKG